LSIIIPFPFKNNVFRINQIINKNNPRSILLFLIDHKNAMIRTTEDDWIILLYNSVILIISEHSTNDVKYICNSGEDAYLLDPLNGSLNYVCTNSVKKIFNYFNNLEYLHVLPFPEDLQDNYTIIDIINFLAVDKKLIKIYTS
jgi:hypothetical protein